jgi:hypothetical protein
VHFALLAADGSLLGHPVHYRDSRTQGIVEPVCDRLAPFALYERTGLPMHPIYTLCQLLALRRRHRPALDASAFLLMMPNLFARLLSGVQSCERTIACTIAFLCQGPSQDYEFPIEVSIFNWGAVRHERLEALVTVTQFTVSEPVALALLATALAAMVALRATRR